MSRYVNRRDTYSQVVSGAWSERECLDLFVQRVEELLACRVARSGGLRAGFTLKGAIGQPMGLEVRQPDEEDFRSFLLTFRQFILNDEPVNLNRVANLCYRLIESDELRSALVDARRRWRETKSAAALAIDIDGARYPPDRVLDLWINGHYFHNDNRKRVELERLDPLGSVFVRHLLLDLVIETTRYLMEVAEIIILAKR